MRDIPFVSVLTPVYNGEKYIAECIESVIGQSYQNLEYIIINNCSTDSTLDIALHYANIDSRIRVINNQKFVGVIENHNIAFKLISPRSVYCKVVSADDWIYPEYLNEMVEFAENNLNVGIVGCYQKNQEGIKWSTPNDVKVISGRELCRIGLLEGGQTFGSPTSLLYRADLIRNSEKFYPHSLSYADTSACYEQLQHCDYGFVHKVLSFGRIHDQQISESVRNLHKGIVASIQMLLEFGPIYLTEKEFELRKKNVIEDYHRWLGGCVLKMQSKEFWTYHAKSLRNFGCPIDYFKVIRYAVLKLFKEIKNPKLVISKIRNNWIR